MQLPRVEPVTIAIAGSDARFPVRRIFCVGQNYADHVREMGGDPTRPAPFFFTKPADAVVASGAELAFPSQTADLHHEVELVVALGRGGANVSVADAPLLVFGHAVGIDLTRRDLQAAAKQAGRPWDMAKGFDQSAPLGALAYGLPLAAGAIALSVNGEQRQAGDLAQMIWNVAEIIATLSTFVTLAGGDLIFTGTPAGVGPVRPGDRLCATLAGVTPLEIGFRG
jgi:fumarylpyruvate hydrolase